MAAARRLRTIARTCLLGLLLAASPARAQVVEDDASHANAAPDITSPTEATTPSVPATEPRYFFHQPELGYGSAARFSPLSVLLDRGFSTLMWDSAERRPLRIEWTRGWTNVWDALAHPMPAIERWGGMKPVLRGQFLPETWNVWEWAFAANYAGHVLAGGQSYRALAEWYDDNGVPMPAVAGAATVMGTILVNEAIESRFLHEGVPSTVFDVYVFEPLGIALFSFDGVARFFARELHAQDWSPQSALTLPHGQLLNGAQMISYHVGLPGIERLDLLSVTGQGTQTGLLWDLDEERSLGAAVGFASKTRVLDELGRERLEARASGALYLSRRGSLLSSLTVFKGMENLAALNLYPGWANGPLRELGLWAVVRRGGNFSLGLTSGRVPGLGLGYDFWRKP
jgi:hypothetical protein